MNYIPNYYLRVWRPRKYFAGVQNVRNIGKKKYLMPLLSLHDLVYVANMAGLIYDSMNLMKINVMQSESAFLEPITVFSGPCKILSLSACIDK